MSEARRRRRRGLVPAGRGVARFQRRGAGRPPEGELGALTAAWVAVVGAPVAAQALPIRRSRAGVLTVACASAAWAQTLAARAHELRAGVAERCPEVPVTSLRFAVADHALPPPPLPSEPRPRPAAPPPGPRARADAERLVGEVADDELRALLVRAAAARLPRADRRT